MHLIELDQECLLHLFSYLDKDSRRSLSLTCWRLRDVFLDPQLWMLLHFRSPCELKRDNFVLGPSLRYLAICWHSSRVKVCNIEDWMKTTFQKDLCSKHESLVSDFLERVCYMCPNLRSLTLSGCGHITDDNVIKVLRSCRGLRSLSLENCSRMTDSILKAVVDPGHNLAEVRVDFCRNVTKAGLQEVREKRPEIHLSAVHSADMIPDSKPEEKTQIRRALQKFLIFS
ncbi:F-box and leucine-rich protein 22 isoform X1 [Triplophysa dalaica]|uniref:F-box and leucine-rich protein 22 isoform X1 n=2 Tax=Triplophysa dalaica TaxID=1582913 RepID=UPI0024E029C9|nr:F-box and leucine-rich protein 22 isoform X1 [Triplophysa dalaica]